MNCGRMQCSPAGSNASKMHILYLHLHFRTPRTGGATRSYLLARALVEAGHQVTMISGSEPGVPDREVCDDILVHRLPITYRAEQGTLRRMHTFWQFHRKALRFAKRLAPPDLVMATSTPLTVGWTAHKLRKKLGWPYVFEARDLWPQVPIELGILTARPLIRRLRRMEFKIVDRATGLIALSPPIETHYKLMVPGKPLLMLPNLADTNFFQPTAPEPGPFRIAYTGSMGFANGLERLVELAEALQERGEIGIEFHLMGGGPMRDQLATHAKRLPNLILYQPGDKQAVRDLLDNCHAALVSFRDEPILETTSPNKLFDALAAGKLVLLNYGGWAASAVENAGAGFRFAPSDANSFLEKLQPFLDHCGLLEEAQRNARHLAESTFSAKTGAQRFVEFIEARGHEAATAG